MDRWPFKRVLPLVAHLQAGGTVPPIRIARTTDGRFRIIDGRHRMHAFKLLGREYILARWGEEPDDSKLARLHGFRIVARIHDEIVVVESRQKIATSRE